MTNIDEQHDHNHLDDNLDRLLKLGEPIPRMPENLKARIRSKLIEMEPASGKRDIFSFRWAAWPLAATAALIFFLILPWQSDLNGTISWADVQKHLDQARTLVAWGCEEITTNNIKEITFRVKTYHKAPGLSRAEFFDSDADPDSVETEPKSITIVKGEPGLIEQLTLYPGAKRAERITHIFRTNGQAISSQPVINAISESLKFIEKTTADKTNRIGDRVIDDIPVVGFSFEVSAGDIGASTNYVVGKVRGEIWVRRDNGLPILAETEFQNAQGENIREEAYDMQWDVPLDESLFDLNVPEGWSLSQTLFESAEYADTGLAPGVTLQIGSGGQEPMVAAGDVTWIVKAEQATSPDSKIPVIMRITIDLKPEAAQHLRDYADAHPDKIIVVNFNGQINVAANLDAANPTQLSFDLSLLRLSLTELEERYFTTTIERNKP